MKQPLFKWGMAPLFACALVAPRPTLAQAVPFTATGWFVEELVPAIMCISSSGQVSLKYEVHVVRSVSDEPRANGRIRGVNLDVSLNSDGSGTFSGKGALEVGTWDAVGNFTPTGGVWDMKYEGVLHADGSTEYRFSGVGIGGPIDSLRVVATATRGALLTDPYLFSGLSVGPAQKPAASQ